MTPTTVVGIDPGIGRVGYALLKRESGRAALISAETIALPAVREPGARLARLAQEISRRLRRDRPDALAIEKLYFSKNAKTALAVAEARGIILLTAHELVHSIWEYAPLEVKLAVAGYGRADKAHIRRAVRLALPRQNLPAGDDAIDAIAIALTAIFHNRSLV